MVTGAFSLESMKNINMWLRISLVSLAFVFEEES